MPNRSSSSSGLPLRGISRTASRCTVKPAGAMAVATASPKSAGHIVIFDRDEPA